jgi:phosphatidylglycerol:prolipoprotein diacylglycerol transferase
MVAALIYTRRHQLDFMGMARYYDAYIYVGTGDWTLGEFFQPRSIWPVPTPFGFGLIIDAQYRIPPYNDLDKYPLTTLFHPTFLYESLWNLAGVGVLISIERRYRYVLRRGDMVLFYAIIYGLGRLWVEGLRTDSLCTDMVGGSCANALRVAQIASIVLIAIGVIGLWLNHARHPELADINMPLPVAPLYDETPAIPTIPIHPSDIADIPAGDVTDEKPPTTL